MTFIYELTPDADSPAAECDMLDDTGGDGPGKADGVSKPGIGWTLGVVSSPNGMDSIPPEPYVDFGSTYK